MRDYFKEIKEQSEAAAPNELCGFLLFDGKGSLEPVRVPNISPSPHDSWEIHKTAYRDATKTGRLFGLFHSHCDIDETFSKDDIATSEAAELPMFVYSTVSKKFNYHRPRVLIEPFENRSFVVGVRDCGMLIIDYYEKKHGVSLPFIARTPHVVANGFGDIESFLSNEMVKVSTPEKGDLLVFSIGAGEQNHVGVYLGDKMFLHQLMGRESAIQPYSEYWQRRTTKVLRLR